jgi:pantetheine-phosphate adenylyltransferase
MLQRLLDKWNIRCDVNTLLSMWNESHRSYHTLDHLNDLIDQIDENKDSFTEKEYEMLLLTAIFHDCIYDPMKNNNEEKSADFFIECCSDKTNTDVLKIKQMILDTKSHKASNSLSHIFSSFDMSIVERDFDQLLDWESGIYDEFKGYGNEKYKEGRLKFLESLLEKYPHNLDNLIKLIDWVKNNY